MRFKFGAVKSVPTAMNGMESNHQGETKMPATTEPTKSKIGTNLARRTMMTFSVAIFTPNEKS
jgi:hypothetical protein